MKVNWRVLIISLAIVFLVGYTGSFFTGPGVESEFYEGTKSALTPPGYVFGIVWPVLFFLIALSLYFAWVGCSGKKEKKMVAWAFGVNLFLNVLWSALFFGLETPLLGFVDIIMLEGTIVWMIFVSGRIDKKASWLLVPYLLWVGFAGVLNYLAL